MFKRALAAAEKLYGPTASETANVFTALGDAYVVAKRYPEAQDMFSRALHAQNKLHGSVHDSVC